MYQYKFKKELERSERRDESRKVFVLRCRKKFGIARSTVFAWIRVLKLLSSEESD